MAATLESGLDTGIITSGMQPQNFAMAVKPFPEVSNVAAMEKASTLASNVMQTEDQQALQNDRLLLQDQMKNGLDFDNPESIAQLKTLQGKLTPTSYQNAMMMFNTAEDRKTKQIENLAKKPKALLDQEMSYLDLLSTRMGGAIDAFEKTKDESAFNAAKQAMVQDLVSQGLPPKLAQQYMAMDEPTMKAAIAKSNREKALREEAAKLSKTEAETGLAKKRTEMFGTSKELNDVQKLQGQLSALMGDPEGNAAAIAQTKSQLDAALEREKNAGKGKQSVGYLTPQGIQSAAEQALSGDKTVFSNMRNGADIAAVRNRIGELQVERGLSGSDQSVNNALRQADAASLQFQTKRNDAIETSSNKINKDIATLQTLMKADSIGDVSLLNTPINILKRKLTGNAEFGKYELALKLVATEYERLIQGGQLSTAQLHAGAAEDATKIINGDMSQEEIREKIPLMLSEIQNQKDAAKEEIGRIKDRMKGIGQGDKTANKSAKSPASDKELQFLKDHPNTIDLYRKHHGEPPEGWDK